MLLTWQNSGGVNSLLNTAEFILPLWDSGAGAVNTALWRGTGSATFTRATTATTVNSAGTIISVASGVARSYYDPSTLEYRGYLAEGARTNLVLNSLIDGTDFSTQSVNVTAVAHTLSFYGTGTITLSGASTAGPLVGTGAYPQRVSLTFTPSAASLTLTVTGSCKYVQLEVGSFASSFIPTAGTSVTRNADVLTYPFSGNADATVGSCYAEVTTEYSTNSLGAAASCLGLDSPGPFFLITNGGAATTFAIQDGTTTTTKTGLNTTANTLRKRGASWGGSTQLVTGDGIAPQSGAFDGSLGSPTNLEIGTALSGTRPFFGTLKNIRIWQTQFSAAQLQAITA